MTALFDYKGFAKDLTKQAENNIPKDIALNHKKEFLEKIYNFTYIAGEAFSKDETIPNSNTAKVLTQMISEWTFHKYIDLLRSNIPSMYHESILRKLGFVAYEMGRESALGKLSDNEMLTLVELQLKKAFEKACTQLLNNGQITKDIFDGAINQSNIDTMKPDTDKNKIKTFKYTLTALCLGLFTVCMNIFAYDFAYLDVVNTLSIIILSMYIGFYIGIKISSK